MNTHLKLGQIVEYTGDDEEYQNCLGTIVKSCEPYYILKLKSTDSELIVSKSEVVEL